VQAKTLLPGPRRGRGFVATAPAEGLSGAAGAKLLFVPDESYPRVQVELYAGSVWHVTSPVVFAETAAPSYV
jgi:hypothetical protein